MNGMLGYMDSARLPFDINDFTKQTEKPMHMLNSVPSKESESTIDDFFKSVMADTYTPTGIVPQPVPPVASNNYYGAQFQNQQQSSSGYDQFNQYDGNASGGQSNVFAGEPNSYVADVQYTTNSNAFNSHQIQPPMPYTLPPPPPPPQQYSLDAPKLPHNNEEYNPDSWEIDMSWNTTQNSSFNQSMDAPHSPPHYERKGVNTNVIEYIEPNMNDSHLTGSRDVDHRQLILPNINGLSALSAKDHGRPVDVDHRNLISLTGSPKLGDKDSMNDIEVMVIIIMCIFCTGIREDIVNKMRFRLIQAGWQETIIATIDAIHPSRH